MTEASIANIASQNVSVDIFLDTTSIELFVNKGEESITMRVTAVDQDDLTIKLYELKAVWK
ncbi:glycosyl hydrolase family 32 domain protein [Francisella sp. TX07-6608]|nr:glycosyl hydrolase family 32 domain protein [Francisella sp. TX07-6608]